jgi:hypothetical protein
MARSEKLRYLRQAPNQLTVFARSWSDEQGVRLLDVARNGKRFKLRIKDEFRGEVSVEISSEDAAELARALAKASPQTG